MFYSLAISIGDTCAAKGVKRDLDPGLGRLGLGGCGFCGVDETISWMQDFDLAHDH